MIPTHFTTKTEMSMQTVEAMVRRAGFDPSHATPEQIRDVLRPAYGRVAFEIVEEHWCAVRMGGDVPGTRADLLATTLR